MRDKPHKAWIDTLKAVCMISVYLCHSEVYYGNGELLGHLVRPFYVNAFFFVSGYLFFGKWLKSNSINSRWGGYLEAIKNVLCRLIIPTIVFSTIIYIPKVLFHSGGLSFTDYLIDVFGGISYWFTSALAVAQVLLLTAVFITKKRTIMSYLLISAIFFAIGLTLNLMRTSTEAREYLPWFYQTGLEYTLVMTIGGVYQRYEQAIDQWVRRLWIIPALAFAASILLSSFEVMTPKIMGLGGLVNFSGLITIACGVMLITAICKRMKAMAWLTWIGKNSIVFYFFSGVFPAMVGTLMLRLCPLHIYPFAIVVTFVAIVLGAITTYLVNRFAPFLVDVRKIHTKLYSANKKDKGTYAS